MIAHFLNLIIIPTKLFILVLFFRALSKERLASRVGLVFMCIAQAVLTFSVELFYDTVIMSVVLTLFSAVAISTAYDMKWSRRLLYSGLLTAVYAGTKAVVRLVIAWVLNISASMLHDSLLMMTVTGFVSNMILLLVERLFELNTRPTDVRVSGGAMAAFLSMPVAAILAAITLSASTFDRVGDGITIFTTLTVFMMVVASVAQFFIFDNIQRQIKTNVKARAAERQEAEKAAYFKELTERQRITNKTLHDLKNKMFALRQAVHENPEKCVEMIEKTAEDLDNVARLRVTGIESVDALLFAKKQIMDADGIVFSAKSLLSDREKIDIFDLCVILGNLLDNAIEACRRITAGEKYVSVSLSHMNGYMNISVTNPLPAEESESEPMGVTAKKDKEFHGFGLQSIRETAEKNGGTFCFDRVEGEFRAIVMMPSELLDD